MATVTCWQCGVDVPHEELCRSCGAAEPGIARPTVAQPAALAVLRFPWGPFTVDEGADVFVGREEGPFAEHLLDNPKVSRRHLRVEGRARTVYVTDLASRNRSFVDDVELNPGEPALVVPGQRVRLGATFEIAIEPPEPGL